MRRLLLIFLLVLLPLQASWAAVCAYCPSTCVVEAEAKPGAIGEQSKQAELPKQTEQSKQTGQSTQATELAGDDDCRCCQLGGVGITSAMAEQTIATSHGEVAAKAVKRFATIRPDRPERPKWTRAA